MALLRTPSGVLTSMQANNLSISSTLSVSGRCRGVLGASKRADGSRVTICSVIQNLKKPRIPEMMRACDVADKPILLSH